MTPIIVNNQAQQETLRRSTYQVGYLEDAMERFIDNAALSRVDLQLDGDVIDGGDGNDLLQGAMGDDQLNGRSGDDTVLGGNGDDIVQGGGGQDQVRNDGGNYPRLDASDAMGVFSFQTLNPTTLQLLLDAADGAGSPQGTVIGGGSPGGNDSGDPTSATPPDPRIISANVPPNLVIGQSVTLTGSVDDLPDGAEAQIQWEVEDSSGTLVALGRGLTFQFSPETAGTYTATAIGTDDANGEGTVSITINIQDVQMIDDLENPGKRILVVGGTALDDDIRLEEVRDLPDSVEIRQQSGNGDWTSVTYDNISEIHVFGGEGDDDLTADRRLTIPVRLFGGAGDDKLRGGTADDYLGRWCRRRPHLWSGR